MGDEKINIFKRIGEYLFTGLSIGYIKFVYKTSKLIVNDNYRLVNSSSCAEKFVAGFWHGDAYCCYPLLRDSNTYIITTQNRRGDFIDSIGRNFGYIPIRVPDEASDGGFIFKIRSEVNGQSKGNLALALDGPLGPYHVPKKFCYVSALATKRRMILISINVKRKLRINSRWDKYVIPLPFNVIEACFNDPIDVKTSSFEDFRDRIINIIG